MANNDVNGWVRRRGRLGGGGGGGGAFFGRLSLPLLAERRGAGVELEKVLAQPQRAALGRALEVVLVVDVHDAKALRVALAPLKVVFSFLLFCVGAFEVSGVL